MNRSVALLVSSALMLAACSPSPDPAAPVEAKQSNIPTHVDMEKLLAEGMEPSLREIARLDYWLHYKLMKATGIEKELGGEAQALAALQALGDAYEKQLRGPQDEIPRMVPASFTGEGMDSGLTGTALALTPAMIASLGATSAMSNLSAADLEKAIAAGPMPLAGKDAPPGGGTATQQYTSTDVTTVVEMDVEAAGLKGKTRSKVRIDTCPDASGTITADISIDSSMQVAGKSGTGGGVSTHMRLVRHLDDNAELMAGEDKDYRRSTDIRVGGREGGDGGRMIDLTLDSATGGDINDTSGIGLFESGEAVQVVGYARQVETTMATIVEAMLTGVDGVLGKPPWESGHCVDLQVTSSPGKRKGVAPGTTFTVDAKPRAKSDGAPTGGSVTATLSGGASLDPGGKVRADATYTYKAPDEKDKSASIAFEARSRRGVGRASAEFDTKTQRAYRVSGGGGQFHGSGTICDLEKPFTISGSGVTVQFTPSSAQGGSYTYSGNMSGFAVWGGTSYTVSADENGGSMTGTGNGCVRTPMGTRCRGGTEKYTLVPTEPCG